MISAPMLVPARPLESIHQLGSIVGDDSDVFVRKSISLLANHPDLGHRLDDALIDPATPDHLQIVYHAIWFVRMGLMSRLQSNQIKKSNMAAALGTSRFPDVTEQNIAALIHFFDDQITLARTNVNCIETVLRIFEHLVRGTQNYALLHTADDVWSDHLLAPVTSETLYKRFGWTFVTDALWLQKARVLARAIVHYPIGSLRDENPFDHAEDFLIPVERVISTVSPMLESEVHRMHCVEGMADLIGFTRQLWDTLELSIEQRLTAGRAVCAA